MGASSGAGASTGTAAAPQELPCLGCELRGRRWGVGDWEGGPSRSLGPIWEPSHTVPIYKCQKHKTAGENIDKMQTHGEFDFNFNRGSGTEGDSSETGHEGEE